MNTLVVSSIAFASVVFLPAISVADQSTEVQLLDAPRPVYPQHINQFTLSQIKVLYRPTTFTLRSFNIFTPPLIGNHLLNSIDNDPLPMVGKQIKQMPSFHDLLNNYELLNMTEFTPWLTNHWSER